MRQPRQIPRPYSPFCGLCGHEVRQDAKGRRVHLQEDGSGELDPEMDRDHSPEPEDYHADD